MTEHPNPSRAGDPKTDDAERTGIKCPPGFARRRSPAAEFFTHVTAQDLRYRFLTSIGKVEHEWLKNLVEIDHTKTENFLAFEDSTEALVATAMLAAVPSLERAEVAIETRTDFKNRGVGWTLLECVSDYATARGSSSWNRSNAATI